MLFSRIYIYACVSWVLECIVLHGGMNALLWEDIGAMESEIRRLVPILKENGGYIFASDHSVPSNVSLDNFRCVTDLIKDIGRY